MCSSEQIFLGLESNGQQRQRAEPNTYLCCLMFSRKLSLFVIHQVANIRLDPNKVCHMAPAVMDGRDRQVVDERIAIFLVVQQLNNAWLTCMDSVCLTKERRQPA